MINQFEGKYEVLSNFSTSTPIFVIIQPGMVSHVSALEYGYQAYKSLDPGVRMLITGASTPGKAKRIGQTVLLRPNWEQIKERVMKDLLIQKFTLSSERGVFVRARRRRPEEGEEEEAGPAKAR